MASRRIPPHAARPTSATRPGWERNEVAPRRIHLLARILVIATSFPSKFVVAARPISNPLRRVGGVADSLRFCARVFVYAALAAAELIRLTEAIPSTGKLRRLLIEHPGFIWRYGFPLALEPETSLGFNPRASLPTARHVTYLRRQMPNGVWQFLLADRVCLIRAELAARDVPAIDCVSLDSKHIIAWVKEKCKRSAIGHCDVGAG